MHRRETDSRKSDGGLSSLNRRARDLTITPIAAHIQKYVQDTVFNGKSPRAGGGVNDSVVVRTVSNVRRMQESTCALTKRY